MRGAGNLKGLRDVRTAISTHHRTVSRHKGTPYLEILSMGMEKLRLEAELDRFNIRRSRIEARLGEIRELMNDRLAAVQEDDPPSDEASPAGGGGSSVPGSMKTMSIGY